MNKEQKESRLLGIARIAKLQKDIEGLSRLTGPKGRPNINALWRIAKDLEGIKLNIKQSGYNIARGLVDQMDTVLLPDPVRVGLMSKACTQADMESKWLAYWCNQLQIGLILSSQDLGVLLRTAGAVGEWRLG